jgi:hypothetical protein
LLPLYYGASGLKYITVLPAGAGADVVRLVPVAFFRVKPNVFTLTVGVGVVVAGATVVVLAGVVFEVVTVELAAVVTGCVAV